MKKRKNDLNLAPDSWWMLIFHQGKTQELAGIFPTDMKAHAYANGFKDGIPELSFYSVVPILKSKLKAVIKNVKIV